MATYTGNPAAGANNPCDGWVGYSGPSQTFSSIRGQANGTDPNVINTSGTPCYISASSTTNQFSNLYRGFFLFDTSSIPANATIISATLSLYGTGKTNGLGSPDIHIASASPASDSTLTNGDFDNIGTTSFGSVSYAGWSTSGYNDFVLNASGLANISKGSGARSRFSAQFSWDINNSFTGTWANGAASSFSCNMADNGTNKPTLFVTYSLNGGNFFAFF